MVLIGYWPLNEKQIDNNAPTAKDYSGNNNHGSLRGGAGPQGTGTTTGPLGQSSYVFDGSDDEFDTGWQPPVGSYTISVWFRTSHDYSGEDGRLVAVRADDNLLITKIVSDNTLRWTMEDDSNWRSIYSNNSLNDGNWHMMLVTVDETNQASMFIDGKHNGSQTLSSFGITDSGKFHGAYRDKGGSYFEGNLSEIRYYNHAITASEAQYLYNVSHTGRQVSSSKSS